MAARRYFGSGCWMTAGGVSLLPLLPRSNFWTPNMPTTDAIIAASISIINSLIG